MTQIDQNQSLLLLSLTAGFLPISPLAWSLGVLLESVRLLFSASCRDSNILPNIVHAVYNAAALFVYRCC